MREADLKSLFRGSFYNYQPPVKHGLTAIKMGQDVHLYWLTAEGSVQVSSLWFSS